MPRVRCDAIYIWLMLQEVIKIIRENLVISVAVPMGGILRQPEMRSG
jgi:hypothetical protein